MGEIKEPSNWKIVIYNDDVTPAGAVAYMCSTILHMEESKALVFVNEIGEHGSGEFGSYPRSIAETKRDIIVKRLADLGYSLKAEIKEIEK